MILLLLLAAENPACPDGVFSLLRLPSSAREEAPSVAPTLRNVKLAIAGTAYSAHLAVARNMRRAGPESSFRPGPLIVSGFLGEVIGIGIGRGAVATVDALQAAGLKVISHDVRPVIDSSPFLEFSAPGRPEAYGSTTAIPPKRT